MTWSKWLTAIRPSYQYSSRNGSGIYSVVLHHGATTSDGVMIQMMVTGSRQVSATAVVKDGRRTGVVDEDYRPWTTASPYWDGRSMTIECANESTDGWTISEASYASLAILLADWSVRYGFPLIRNGRNSTVFGHREIYTYFGDSYATACPGGMDVDRVVRDANAILAGNNTPPEDDMPITDIFVPFKKSKGQPIAAGTTAWLHINDKAYISVYAKATEQIQGNLQVQVSGGKAYGSSFKVTPFVNNIKDGKIVSSISLGAREIIFSGGDTFGEVNINCGLTANQKIAFKIGDSSHAFTVKSAVFRGWAKD
jgi:hypothetical protein